MVGELLTEEAATPDCSARPLVSVVIPNYNKGDFVSAALASVLDQTLKDLEVVLVDDASSDSSVSQARELLSKDSRIRILQHPRRKGPGAARNTGIRAARGMLIALLDSDDVYAPEWLEHAVRRISTENSDCVAYADWWLINARGERLSRKRAHTKSSGYLFGDFLLQSLEVNSVLVAPKQCFLEAGLYDESVTWGEDYDMVLRLAKRFPFVYVDEEAYGYRLHPGNSWRPFSKRELYRYKARVLERYVADGEGWLTPDEMSVVEARLASYYSRSGQRWRLLRHDVARYLRALRNLATTGASVSARTPASGALKAQPTAEEKNASHGPGSSSPLDASAS